MCTLCRFAQALAPTIQAHKISRGGFVASTIAAGAILTAANAGDALADSGAADVIFVNGKVYTVDLKQPWAQAVAVRGRRIVYVGETAGSKALVGKKPKSSTSVE